MSETVKTLEDALVELKKDKVLNLTKKILDEKKIDMHKAVNAVTNALNRIGDLYQEEEYYLAELVYAGDLAKQVLELLKPHMISEFTSNDSSKLVVIGTVKGDMHDLGKNLVQAFAEGAGYQIIDLGTNVPSEVFINEVKKRNAKILGVSCLLTACDSELPKIITALNENNLKDVKVVIGGAAMTEAFAKSLEKEHQTRVKFAPDAITGIKIFNELID